MMLLLFLSLNAPARMPYTREKTSQAIILINKPLMCNICYVFCDSISRMGYIFKSMQFHSIRIGWIFIQYNSLGCINQLIDASVSEITSFISRYTFAFHMLDATQCDPLLCILNGALGSTATVQYVVSSTINLQWPELITNHDVQYTAQY